MATAVARGPGRTVWPERSPDDAWVVRREPHPDAPGLAALVTRPREFIAADLFRHATWSSGSAADRDPAQFATTPALWNDTLQRGLRTPFFRLVRDGGTIAASAYCRTAGVGHRTIDDVIQPNRVIELHQAGATMVIQGLQLSDPHLGRFANNLALALDQPVQINAYLSPAAAKGLELHFDYHDVFVVQLDGRKRWRVWEPFGRTREPVRGGTRIAMPTFDELGEPHLDLTLEAGDCLYLPRGFPHAAETIESASSHLTVGVMAVTWQRALHHAVDAAVAGGAYRSSIDPSTLDGPTPGFEPLAAPISGDAIRRWMTTEVWRRQPATRLRPFDVPVIALDTDLAVTPGPLLWLAPDPDGAQTTLGLGDRSLQLPVEAHGFLAALLQTSGPFTLHELGSDLDPDSRLVVGARLAAEGVLARA